MADSGRKPGWTPIRDALLEAIIRAPMPGRHIQVLLAIHRLTAGWGRQDRDIGAALIASVMETDATRPIRACLADLERWGLITRTPNPGRAPVVRIVEDVAGWLIDGTARSRVQGRPATREADHPATREADHPATQGTATRDTPRKKRNTTRRRAIKSGPPQWSMMVAGLLAQLLLERRPGAQIPTTLRGWASEVAKIKAEPGAIVAAVRWLYSEANEGQFRIEVQSGATLARKFGQVLAAVERGLAARSRDSWRHWEEQREGVTPEPAVLDFLERKRREGSP